MILLVDTVKYCHDLNSGFLSKFNQTESGLFFENLSRLSDLKVFIWNFIWIINCNKIQQRPRKPEIHGWYEVAL